MVWMPAPVLPLLLVVALTEPSGAVPRHSQWKVAKTGEIELAENPKLRLNVQGGEIKEGAPLILWPCSAGNNEIFDFADNGLIKLRANPEYCLNAEGGAVDGAKIITWPCAQSGVPNPNEAFEHGKDKRIRLREHPDKCINVKESHIAHGTELVVWSCGTEDNHTHDKFVLKDGLIQLEADRDFHLNVAGGDVENSSSVVIWNCAPGLHELFMFTYPENRLRMKYEPDMCVNAEGGIARGHRLVIWPCHHEAVAHERFVYDEAQQLILAEDAKTLSFNVKGAQMEGGGEIILWSLEETEEL